MVWGGWARNRLKTTRASSHQAKSLNYQSNITRFVGPCFSQQFSQGQPGVEIPPQATNFGSTCCSFRKSPFNFRTNPQPQGFVSPKTSASDSPSRNRGVARRPWPVAKARWRRSIIQAVESYALRRGAPGPRVREVDALTGGVARLFFGTRSSEEKVVCLPEMVVCPVWVTPFKPQKRGLEKRDTF